MWIRGNYHSYTFAIYPDDDKGYVENLFLHLQPDGTYMAFLVQYDFNEDDLDNLKKGKNMPNLSAQTVFYPLPDFDSNAVLQGRSCLTSFVVNCTYQVTVIQTPKEQGDLVGCDSPDCLYDYTYTYTLIGCTYSSTDCGGLMTTGPVYDRFSANGGSGGGGPKIGEHPIIGISVSDDAKHIRELNKITDEDSPMRYKIDEFYENLDNPLVEEGIEFRKSGPNYTVSPVQFQEQFKVKFFEAVPSSIVRIHKHHLGADPVFSAGDIFAMAEFYMQKDNLDALDKDDISSLIVSKKGVYALRVDDPDKVKDFHESLDALMDFQDENGDDMTYKYYLEKVYLKNVVSKSQKQCDGNCTDEEYDDYLHANFVKFFNAVDHGLKLFYAPHTPNGTYTWTKISK